jgi:hypothetical protein
VAGVLVAICGISLAALAVAAPTIVSIGSAADASEPAVRGDSVEFGPPATAARYRVTIVQEWGPATHPTTLPSGWHSSPAVLAAHRSAGDMFAPGVVASPGIENMAETGSTFALLAELSATPTVGDVDTGRGIDRTGSDTLEVAVDGTNGYLSLVTMLAPSPDWFVGFPALQVYDRDGWLERIVVDLQPYDAGTDSGTQFRSGNVDTQPRQLVSGPRDNGFAAAAGEGRFGYVVIERIA